MGTTFIKPKADEDFYILYSSFVDSPVAFGSRAEFEEDEYWDDFIGEVSAERFERADKFGTSAQWGSPAHGWHETELMVREGIVDPTRGENVAYGLVKREDLRKFCESLGEDGTYHPEPGIVTWIKWEDDYVS